MLVIFFAHFPDFTLANVLKFLQDYGGIDANGYALAYFLLCVAPVAKQKLRQAQC